MEKIDTDYKRWNLKSLAKLFKPFNRDWAPLTSFSRFVDCHGNQDWQIKAKPQSLDKIDFDLHIMHTMKKVWEVLTKQEHSFKTISSHYRLNLPEGRPLGGQRVKKLSPLSSFHKTDQSKVILLYWRCHLQTDNLFHLSLLHKENLKLLCILHPAKKKNHIIQGCYLCFSNSLIIHQVKTKKITIMKEVCIPSVN